MAASTSRSRRGRGGGGQWNFTGQASGLGMADFLLGRIGFHGSVGLTGVDLLPVVLHGSYIQDTWRATSRLTVNAGLRWEPFFSQNLTRGANTIFDPRAVPERRQEHRVPQCTRRVHLPGRPGLSGGHVGLEQEVVEPRTARRHRVGRAGGRPPGGSLVVRAHV